MIRRENKAGAGAREQGRGSLPVHVVREGLAAKGLEQQPEQSEKVRSGKSILETGNSKHKGPRWEQNEAAVLEDLQADQSVCSGMIRRSEGQWRARSGRGL